MLEASTPQPAPTSGTQSVLDKVIEDLIERSDFGLKKYGTRLMVDNGRDHLLDAYQEAMDLVMYLRAEIIKRST